MPDSQAELEIDRIMDAIAESALNASDEEINEEVRQQGLDPQQEAARLRAKLKTGGANA